MGRPITQQRFPHDRMAAGKSARCGRQGHRRSRAAGPRPSRLFRRAGIRSRRLELHLVDANAYDAISWLRVLAEALLENCEIARYTLVDFSPQMLDLSRSRLVKFQDQTVFIRADFKKPIGQRGFAPASISSSRSRPCTSFATQAASRTFMLSSIVCCFPEEPF